MRFQIWADLPLRFKGLAVIAIPLFPLFILAWLVTVSTEREREAQAQVAHALEVKADIATLYGFIADAETGVRGYLLTRQPDSLQVVRDAAEPLRAAYARVRKLIRDDVQRGHLARLEELSKANPLKELLAFAAANPITVPPPAPLLARSRSTMAQMRVVLGAMQTREDEVLAERTELARVARERLRDITLGSVALGVGASVLAALAFTTGIANRIRALRGHAARLARGETWTERSTVRDEVGHLATALDEASALLTQRQRELDQFFSLSLDLLCIADANGRFTRVNRAWQSVLGWSADELTAAPFLDFIHPDDVAATVQETSVLARGGVTVGFENRYRHSDGSYRWLSWKATSDPERGVIYAAARDVTEQKLAATDLKLRMAELAALNQELEAFSYSVSHDLRAPLRHITGFAALLEQRSGAALDEQSQRHLTTIKDAASRMGRLIDDLLAFSRMSRTQLSKRLVDLDALVSDARRELEAVPDTRQAQWVIHSLPTIVGDTAMLRLAFVNLLSNALKYAGGRTDTRIEIGVLPSTDPGEIIVFVRDNGVGFDMQYVGKLFGVFQRLHRSDEFEGTGIGLANVRRIVHRHGGRVWAEGVIDEGATFYVALPREERTECDGRAA